MVITPSARFPTAYLKLMCPADKKATVFEGAVTKVEMHNELRDTPKTGDDSNPTLWIALMGIACCGRCYLRCVRNQKQEEKGGC